MRSPYLKAGSQDRLTLQLSYFPSFQLGGTYMQKMTTPSHTTLTPPHTITHTLAQVYKLLRTQGHNVVAVFTIPDVKGRPDPLAEAAESDKVPVFKFPRWRTKGKPLPEVRQLVVCPVAAILECVCVWGGGGMCVW